MKPIMEFGFSVGHVPKLSEKEGGIYSLTPIQRREFERNIVNFKKRFGSNEPKFFIDNSKWDLLLNGKTIDKNGKITDWLRRYPKKAVYGFSISYCYNRSGVFYLKINTILHTLGTEDLEFHCSNLAFFSLGRGERPVLKFISESEQRAELRIARISRESYRLFLEEKDPKKREQKLNRQLRKLSPKIVSIGNNVPFENEGILISSNRVKELLSTFETTSKGMTLQFAYKQKQPFVTLCFDINPGFEGGIPYPPPLSPP
ncbi:MAG: hypothetical protein ACRCVT_08630 [Leadbetterella sp.]